MTQEYPKCFARFYDLIYHQQRDGVDNDYYLKQVLQTKGKVLEIGVGTGRLFTNALNKGADIYGIDISQPMTDVLFKKLDKNQHYRISLQNIIDFNFNFEFDLIIAPFRVVMHLLNKEDQIKALNNVYNHLKTNGKFIFDAFVPDLSQLITGIDNFTDFEGEYEKGKILRRIVSTKPDLINQVINITFRLEWDDNKELRQEVWKVPLRFFFRYELERLVEQSNFQKYKIFGDFLENELNQNSKEFIVICQK